MKPLPQLSLMPRAREDLRRCLEFMAGYRWGRPDDRERDIADGTRRILLNPEGSPARSRRRKLGLKLRRCNAAQFVILYVYVHLSALFPRGMVSVRAIRHGSERNVFWGVREQRVPYGGTGQRDKPWMTH